MWRKSWVLESIQPCWRGNALNQTAFCQLNWMICFVIWFWRPAFTCKSSLKPSTVSWGALSSCTHLAKQVVILKQCIKSQTQDKLRTKELEFVHQGKVEQSHHYVAQENYVGPWTCFKSWSEPGLLAKRVLENPQWRANGSIFHFSKKSDCTKMLFCSRREKSLKEIYKSQNTKFNSWKSKMQERSC